MPENVKFKETLHHDMVLNLPERERLVRLKKVYYLCMRFPWLEKPLTALTKYPIPFLFDLLFLLQFTRYALRAENLSLFQYLYHLKQFVARPFFRR